MQKSCRKEIYTHLNLNKLLKNTHKLEAKFGNMITHNITEVFFKRN